MELSNLRKIRIAFSQDTVSTFKTLLKACPLPSEGPIPSAGWGMGMPLGELRSLRSDFLNSWSYDALEEEMNRFPHFLATVQGTGGADDIFDLHFVHVKSERADAIPLILLHGWPGTFWDFHQVIEPLTNPPAGQTAFHVVVPSLPGYVLSTLPKRQGWTLYETAHAFHALMTSVLGYPAYSGQGGDWGSYILRIMGALYPSAVRAMHFNMFRAPIPKDVDPNTFTEAEKHLIKRRDEFAETGRGYMEIQSTMPSTIGFAIGSSPVAVLAYIGEKLYAWSDPTTLRRKDILDNVALYWLSGCFASSVLIYHQNKGVREQLISSEAQTKLTSPVGFTHFAYEIGAAPRASIAAHANLKFYKAREIGGHFAALDNPDGLVEDLREFIGKEWTPGN